MSNYRQQKAARKAFGKTVAESSRRDSSPPPAPHSACSERAEVSSRAAALPRPAVPPARAEKIRTKRTAAERVPPCTAISPPDAALPPGTDLPPDEKCELASGKVPARGSKRNAFDKGKGRGDPKKPKNSWNFDYQSEYNICTDKVSTVFLVRKVLSPGM